MFLLPILLDTLALFPTFTLFITNKGKKSFGTRLKEKVKDTFSRKKPKNNNPQSSYPKQEYRPTSVNTGKLSYLVLNISY